MGLWSLLGRWKFCIESRQSTLRCGKLQNQEATDKGHSTNAHQDPQRKKKSIPTKKVEAIQEEAEVQDEEYNPWAEDDENIRKERNKKELGEAMYDPEKVLPRYC